MGRRKRDFLEDDDMSDSSGGGSDDEGGFDPNEDPDVRAERELYSDPYKRKRRRKNGKEDAIYGVLGEDDEEEERPRRGLGSRTNMKKLPTFVSGDSSKMEVDKEEDAGEGEDAEEEDSSAESESDNVDAPASPGESDEYQQGDADEEEEEKPSSNFASMSAAAKVFAAQSSSTPEVSSSPTPGVSGRGGIGSSSRGGIGASRGGIGAAIKDSLPTSFGTPDSSKRPQRSFVRSESNKGTSTPLSREDAVHFSKLQGTFGAKMLAKMGWEAGSGLGTSGQGIVTPIESKLRPQRAGIAHGGFKEKTKQSIQEAKRRGEEVSDDEPAAPSQRKAKAKAKQAKETREQWKKPPKKKTVVQHRTFEEIMEEAGQDAAASGGLGVIIDATGATPREVNSITEVSASPWGATNDPTRLPELRHNLRLIVDLAKGELDGLAREAKALQERKKWIKDEDARLRKAVLEEAELIQRLQKVHIIVDDINTKAKEVAGLYEPSLDSFSPQVISLIQEYPNEYEAYKLDDIVVAAIAPVLRRLVAQWNPLEDPSFLTEDLRKWRKALRMSAVPSSSSEMVLRGGFKAAVTVKQEELVMTPYESLLWNVWLPKLRSCINNDWNPSQPQPLIQLLEAWSDILPRFIWDNMLDQLILPKLQKAILEWNPKRNEGSLHALVFPWLPHVGLRLELVVGDARRKVKSLFRSWTPDQGLPSDLMVWEKVFDAADWEAMLLKYVVPKLGTTLRDDFRINPRKQDMEPLRLILAWTNHLRGSIVAQLLEAEFFPKWLNILHVWLIQPSPNFEEIMQWYSFWKSSFPEEVRTMPRVEHGFAAGLQLMNNAMDLGPDAPRQLKKPEFKPFGGASLAAAPETAKKARPAHPTAEITFRSIVEDFAAQHNLLFIPTGKTHERSRMPLYKVSPNVDGKGGITAYILDDAVWTADGGGEDYRAIGLEDMVLRATKGTK